MKKNFKVYVICWAILLAVFNVICFATPNLITVEKTEYVKFGGAFWAGYVFITLAFIGQLACAHFAFRAENAQKLFYNLPLITVSYTGLVLTIIFGAICMAIPNLPNWVGIIVCAVVLAFNTVAIMKASAAAEIVSGVDEKVTAQTQFIKTATGSAQNLMNHAKSEAAKAACKKVYEALRYANPVRREDLTAAEAKITEKLKDFGAAVDADADSLSEMAEEIVLLVREWNISTKR